MKTSLAPVLSLLGAVLLLLTQPDTTRANEMRALWVDAWGAGFLTPAEVTTLVNNCRTYNFNAVIVQMRRRGDAFYFPQAPNGDPRTTVISGGYDALQELINQCHSGSPRIEVHCWVVTHLIWSDSVNPPSQGGHVYNLHPEYLMKNSLGQTFMAEGYYLDPGHPDATMWNYNMAMDIVSRYNIDGFQWDYIRYPQQDSGYNATAIARYNAEFGLSGQPAPADAQFSTWRRRQVTDFLRWVNADLLAIKPNLQISTAVFANRTDALNNRFQDWAAWNNEGIIDLCLPMNYSSDNAGVYNPRVDDAFNNQGVRRVYMGQGGYLNTKENTVTQLTYARNKPLLGTVLYSYRTPNSGTVNQSATFTHIRDFYQPTYAAPPTLPWKTSPTRGIVKGTVTRQDTGEPVYNATVTLQTAPVRNQLTEAHGKYAFFESVPGSYNISATGPGFGVANGVANVTAGGNVTVNLVLPLGDTTPPIISGVSAGNITDSAATISWTTDELSDSVVEYGLTTAYGSSVSDASLVVSHSLGLSGLSANTTYHYRVKSTDGSGNQAVSGNFTFVTLPAGAVQDIIIDNPAATVVGSWSTGTSAGDKYGSDYRFKGQGTGAAYLQFTPNILTAGNYDVFTWHPQGSNRTTNAPHAITFNGGTQTVYVNQKVNGGAWNLLGTFNFAAGTAGHIRITDGFSDAGQVVMADAIKLAHVPPPAAPAAPSGLSATAVSTSQINLSWTDNSSTEDGFDIERSTDGVNFSYRTSVGVDATSWSDTGLSASTTYYYRIRAYNAGGNSPYSNVASATTQGAPPVTVTYKSVAADDGWVLESTETSNVGGSRSSTASNTSALRAGDDNADKQYKTVVSFDTSPLPDGATIVSAKLRLKRGTVSGTNPFTTHGACYVDIKGGSGFGGNVALANSDFEAAADATQVATMSDAPTNGSWSEGNLNATGLSFVNKTGRTQLRVYFALDDNDDLGNDYIGWYSGENSTSSNRPELVIEYQP